MTDYKKMLVIGAKELGVEISDSQVDACFRCLAELKKWNRKISLTAIRDDREIVIKHFLDSFSFLSGIPPEAGMKLLDMGSGAGFPGLPIKIARPELLITLVESVKKKASFLRHVVRLLGLSGVEVQDVRTDELPNSALTAYDVVTARAFADMAAAIKQGAPFLKPGGVLVLSRGPEEKVTDEAMEKAGMALDSRKTLTLPYSEHERAVWVFTKK